MTKVDFSNIIIQDIEGHEVKADVKKELGNRLYMQGQNIEECELGKKIYFTPKDELTELDDKEVAIIKTAIAGYGYVLREGISQALKQ